MLSRFTLVLILALFSKIALSASTPEYKRATEDEDNVKLKKFTKKDRVEVSVPNAGFIINQSFITTYLLHSGLTYYTSEEVGFSLELSYGMNVDEDERNCLETFYNDPKDKISAECGNGSDLPERETDEIPANYGPAYMPIREINYIISGNFVWNPVYGKQLLLHSATSYFDVFLTLGGGAVMSTYYPKSTKLRNGKKSRAEYVTKDGTGALNGGAAPGEKDQYGASGRPNAEQQTNAFINLGIGQRYHFWKRYSIRFEFRNMTLLGTPNGFENLFAIWLGLGIRM